MDQIKTGNFIRKRRQALGLTQKELADKLDISFQAVSKWENGESLPDTALLLKLSDTLNTTADILLNGGTIMEKRSFISLDDVIAGFQAIEDVGKYFGKDSTFYQGMIEGIDSKMNIDIEGYLKDQDSKEVMYAEVLIQAILKGKQVDMDEISSRFTNRKMVEVIRGYINKTEK